MALRQTANFHIIIASILLTSVIVPLVVPEKILVLTFYASKSNKITYMTLIEELAARGHEITVISPVKSFRKVDNITEILTFDVLSDPIMNFFPAFQMKQDNLDTNWFIKSDFFKTICERTYDLPHIKDFINARPTFDLIILQSFFNDCVLGLAYKLNAPIVLFSPVSVPHFNVGKIGGHLPPSFVPNILAPFAPDMSFFMRLQNFGLHIFMELTMQYWVEPSLTEVYREKLGDPTLPSVGEILANASLLLSNGHFGVFGPRPNLPNVVDIGGIHSRPAKPLHSDLEDFILQGEHGFILFSLGSIIETDQMPSSQRQIFVRVFSSLKEQVIWKWDSETMPDLPKNVMLSKWLPQQDLLGHPKIKMFITHCGGGGLEESIYHGVPLIGMPFWGDQFLNFRTAKNLNILVELDWNTLTEESLFSAIRSVLDNSKYRDNAKRISSIFRDNPVPPLQLGVYWVEYVMRHKGAPHLKTPGRNLSFIQYHCIDVIAVYISLITFYLWLTQRIFCWLLKCLHRIYRKVSQKQKVM